MPKNVLFKLLACSCFAALGGCQFLGNLHLTHRAPAARSDEPQLAVSASPATQAGRDHLRAGNPGLAIDAYNQALAYGEEPAAAYNGLGVSYARIGRTDLAYRFFRKAVMSDPLNPVYARNLATLVDSPAFTLDQMKRAEPTPQVAIVAQPAPAQAAARPRVTGKLYREEGRQFSLVTVAPADPSGPQTAAQGDCRMRRPARKSAQCQAIPLPTMQSRNTRPTSVAVYVPASGAKAASPAEPSETAAPAPAGKRKTVNLIGQPQAAPEGQRPSAEPSRQNAAT